MKQLLLFLLILTAINSKGQDISFSEFIKACDSMTYYDVVSTFDFEILDSDKQVAIKKYKLYNNIVEIYSKQHENDSTEIAISIMGSYIIHAHDFRRDGKYYQALKSCDRSVDYLVSLSDDERTRYWQPYLSDMHFNRFLVYYNIFNDVGFSIGANEALSEILKNIIQNIDNVPSFELTETFSLFSESELQKKYSRLTLDSIYGILCEQSIKRYSEGNISDVQYYYNNKILLDYLNSNSHTQFKCSLDFDKIFDKIIKEIATKKIAMMEGAFFFEPYLHWKTLLDESHDSIGKYNEVQVIMKKLISIKAYKDNDDIYYSLRLSYENTKTLNFHELSELKTEFDKILFCNRNFDNFMIERNMVSNAINLSYLSVNFIRDSKYQPDYDKYLFNHLNLFDFDKTDKLVLDKINNIPMLTELSYFSVIEYQIRKNISDRIQDKYVYYKQLKSSLDSDEALIYSQSIDLNYEKAQGNPILYKPKNAKCLVVVTKNKLPNIFILEDYIKEDFYSDYNVIINSNQKVPLKVKEALKGINKIYTYDDPWPLLDTDGNYMCHNYEFHKITSLNEIVNKKEKSIINNDKYAVIFSNPDYSGTTEHLYADNFKGQSDTITRSASEDLAYYVSDKKTNKEQIVFKPLPNSELEAKEIVGIFQKNNIKTIWYNGNQAKEDNVYNQPSPYILHFATHGTLLNRDSLDKSFLFYNALALSSATNTINKSYSGFIANKYDGLLTGLEIVKLNLSSTELVVLSACETGKGSAENWINGTYFNSLQRAFRLAGAKAVLASKWKVPDKETQELMVEFYTNWLEKKMSKHKALQQAQLTLSKKYPEPYKWAAWVLYGD